MAWKPEVFVENKWSRNGLVFATEAEALANAQDLMHRWILVDDARAVEITDPDVRVNYSYTDGKLVEVK